MDVRSRLLKLLSILVRNLGLKSDKLNINPTLVLLHEKITENGANSRDRVAISETEKNIRGALTRVISTLLEWDRKDQDLPNIEFILSDFESAMRGDVDYYDTVETTLLNIVKSSDTVEAKQRITQSDLTMLSQDIRGSDISLKLFKMSNNLSTMVGKGENVAEELNEFVKELEVEARNLMGDGKEDLISYMDSDDPDSVTAIVDEMFAKEEGGSVLQFGWQKLNTALQKGVRLGEFMAVSAVQHMNKTGVTLGLFRHLAIFNKPVIRKEGKKPLLIRWSFEDDLTSNYQYILKDSVHDNGGEFTGLKGLSKEYVTKTVMDELTQHGWKIIMVKANPSEWNYMKMQAFVNGLINEGFDPQIFMCDYLLKMPTTGCERTGPMGTDYRDLVRRTRNYFNKIGCAFISPFQLNSTANTMLREGVRPIDFLPAIATGGFNANSKQIIQELDISLLIHIVKNGSEYHQHFLVDKHRLPTYVDENKKSFFLPLPENFMPLKSDIGKEETGCYRLKTMMDDVMEF